MKKKDFYISKKKKSKKDKELEGRFERGCGAGKKMKKREVLGDRKDGENCKGNLEEGDRNSTT